MDAQLTALRQAYEQAYPELPEKGKVLSDERLAEIRERWAKGSPAPWTDNEVYHCVQVLYPDDMYAVCYDGNRPEVVRDDMNKIGHSPQDVADLLAEVERLRAVAEAGERFIRSSAMVIFAKMHGCCDHETDELEATLRAAGYLKDA